MIAAAPLPVQEIFSPSGERNCSEQVTRCVPRCPETVEPPTASLTALFPTVPLIENPSYARCDGVVPSLPASVDPVRLKDARARPRWPVTEKGLTRKTADPRLHVPVNIALPRPPCASVNTEQVSARAGAVDAAGAPISASRATNAAADLISCTVRAFDRRG